MDWTPQIRDHVTVQKSINWYFLHVSKSYCISVIYNYIYGIFVYYALQSYKIRPYSDLSVCHRSVWAQWLASRPGFSVVTSFWGGEGVAERTVNSEQFWRRYPISYMALRTTWFMIFFHHLILKRNTFRKLTLPPFAGEMKVRDIIRWVQ
jgi:hypothetical protein